MEKAWDDFWVSGKVTDYLAYKNAVPDEGKTVKKEEQRRDGTAGNRDWNGFDSHAC